MSQQAQGSREQNKIRSAHDAMRKLAVEQRAYKDGKSRQSQGGGSALNPYHRASQDSSINRVRLSTNTGSKKGDSSRKYKHQDRMRDE